MGDRNKPVATRFGWGRWLLIAGGVFVLLLIGGYFTIAMVADARLTKIIADYQTAHERIRPQDFTFQAVPESQNAVTFVQRAISGVHVTTDEFQAMDKLNSQLPFTAEERDLMDSIVANNANCLADLRQARAIELAAPTAPVRLSPQSTTISSYATLRRIAQIAQDDALLQHQRGHNAESFDRLFDLFSYADRIRFLQWTFITHLVAFNVQEMGADALSQIAPEIRFRSGPDAPSVEQARALIAQLRDESPINEAFRDSMDSMRAAILLWAEPSFGTFLIGTAFKMDAARMLVSTTKFRDAGLLSNFPAAQAAMPRASVPPQLITPLRVQVPNYNNQFILIHFHALAERRMAAIVLAIQLYRNDHSGQLPTKLEELSPDYLPTIPADPMATDGRTFGYNRDGSPPLIYSVGDNEQDDHASTQPSFRTSNSRAITRWQTKDAVMYLAPTSRPTTEQE